MNKTKTITIVLTLIAILAPTILFPTNPYFLAYMPKNIVLLVGGALLLILLLSSYKDLKIDKKDILLIIFLLLIFISTLFSSNIKRSIFGSITRYEGLLMFLTYACIYFAAKKFFKYKNTNTFLNIMFYVSIAIGILGIVQNYYHTFEFDPFFSKGISGTFVNSNFFGSFISIILPASMAIFILKGNKKSFILSLVMFFNMISSGTRSAWIAFIVISFIGFVYLIKQKDKTFWKRSLIIFISFVIIFSYLFSPIGSSITQDKIYSLKKDFEIFAETGFNNKLGSNRMEIWITTLKLIIQNPIIGCGTDNLAMGLASHCQEDFIKYAVKHHSIIDKAHNEFLHIAATNGIPALIIYLTFLGLILFPKTKTMFKDKKTFLFSLCIISYLVQAFFNISTLGVAPLFWMILGLCDNEYIEKGENYE